jgi:hypothetical protein
MVAHFLGNANSSDVLPGQGVTPSDASKFKSGLKINWGNLLKAAPNVIGHVVQIGTTIASVLGVQDGD